MTAKRQTSRFRFALVLLTSILLSAGGIFLVLGTADRKEADRKGYDGAEVTAPIGADGRGGGGPAVAAEAGLGRAMARLKARANAVAAQRSRQVTPAIDERLGYPGETVTLAHEVFDEMWAVRGLVHTHEQRTDAARRLLTAPRALELVHHIATDPSFAREAFGEQQAEARYFSILVMEEAAKGSEEHQELLKHAVGAVHRGLISDEGFDRGRGEDFRGLLTAYAGIVSPTELDAEMIRTLGYDSNLSQEMKQIYFETVFSVLWKSEGIEVAEARFKEIFPES